MKKILLTTGLVVLAAFATVQVNAACDDGSCHKDKKKDTTEQTDKK